MDILDIAIAKQLAGGGGGSGTDNYNDLSNLPKINDVTLSGNKTSANLGLQSEINSDSKLASDLIDDTNQDNKFVTSAEKTTWNGKQNAIDADHKINADYVDDSTSTNKFVTASDKETWSAKQNAIDNSHKLSSDLVDDTNHTNKFVTSTEKNTWNGKQNAIDSDHKLSSSLVSFTIAETAALASGIDSAKVAQISTNQSNILYVLNKSGSKNVLVPKYDKYTNNEVSYTVNADGTITVVIASTTASNRELPITDAISNVYDGMIISGSPSGTDIEYLITGLNSDGTYENEQFSYNQAHSTINRGTPKIRFSIYVKSGTAAQTVTFYPMVQDASITDFTFAKPALPNYDLTYLQAEDRASLAEVVDSGAKNLLDTSTTTVSNITFTQDSNSYITASPNNADTRSWNYANTQYKLNLKAGTYIFAMDIKTATSNTGIGFNLYSSNGTSVIHSEISEILNKTGMITWQFTITTEGTYGVIYKCFDMVARLMVATKAAFGVSQKFVPWRVPIKGVYVRDTDVACSTTLTTTGIKFTATEKAAYRITATAIYYNSIPMKVVIKYKTNSSANQLPFCAATHADGDDVSLIASGIMSLDVGGEFEVFAQYASPTSNYFYVLVEKIG